MLKNPLAERWEMWKKVELKESKDNSKSLFGEKSIKKLGHEKGKIERWKACKIETIFEEARAKVKGARTLATHTYFLACPKAKFCPSQHKRGEIEEEYEKNMGTKGHT
jgi:hypothetical protein